VTQFKGWTIFGAFVFLEHRCGPECKG
jgi:hypothetical protein